MPVVFREAFEAHSSQPLYEVETILFDTVMTRCSVMLRVVLFTMLLFKSIVIVVVVLELKLIIVVKRVALLLLMLQLPVVGCNWRVCWEASIHVCLIHTFVITSPLVMLWLRLLVLASVLQISTVYWVGRFGIVFLMVAIFGALTMVMVEICHSRLMIKNVAFFRVVSQIHHWSSVECETVGNIVTLFD